MLLSEERWRSKIYLGGSWGPGGGGEVDVLEPATGQVLTRAGLAAPEDVSRATAAAAIAQRDWAARPFGERAQVMWRAAELLERHAAESQAWLVRESGSPQAKARVELSRSAEECREAAALAMQPFGEVLRSPTPRLSFSRRLPVGLVGVIAPFNAPVLLSIRSVAPALALGNAVLLKPDPRTPISGGALLASAFEQAGLPAGLLSILPGGGEVGQALIVDRQVRVIAFTGSTHTGRAVASLCGQHLKRAHLELGGNSALIVMEDVDVEQAAALGAQATYTHAGQICMAAGRHIVASSIAERYAQALAARAERLRVGDPRDERVEVGPLIDAHQRDRVAGLVRESVAQGARLLAGGTSEQLFYRPTVLANTPPSAAAYAQEAFGPVAPIVSFETDEEAVALAADSDYGLSLSILAGDGLRALELAAQIPTGAIHINDHTIQDEAAVPFGGVGISGNGSRNGGLANLEAYTETQWVTARSDLAAALTRDSRQGHRDR